MEDIHRQQPQPISNGDVNGGQQPPQQLSQQQQTSPSPSRQAWWKRWRWALVVLAIIIIAVIIWLLWPSSSSNKVSKNPVVQSYQNKLPALKKAAADSPKDAGAQIRYAQALYVTGDKNQAVDEYKDALEINPKDATTYNNLGNASRDLGDYSAAENAYKQAIKLNPTGQNAYVNLANMQIYTLKKPSDGVATYQLAIKNIGASPQFELLLGLAYESNNQPDKARATYKSILAKDPKNQAAEDNLKRLDNS